MNTNAKNANNRKAEETLSKEEANLWKTLQEELNSPLPVTGNDETNTSSDSGMHPLITFGLVAAFVAHGAIMFSLPPVLQGKGAPFLPTSAKGIGVMFRELKKLPQIVKKIQQKKEIRFLDLGSGDGRVVFRAAREGYFYKSIGYEINPVLHAVACLRGITPKYVHNTKFKMQDLWSVDLTKADVVAVYGLYPIMDKLGKKMKSELRPGSIVVSNVFTIPGWKPLSGSSSDKVHFYSIPESIIPSRNTSRSSETDNNTYE
uniref:DOT1 domain-containing protein n=1 Tax=Chaetoceros debilis TaxID=122233 RepID=A0A7S3V4K3_9STRA|mmetsp:Transcript_21983/g.33421  ORF Transcript_21983/g.33421 Transcript_21983/m.33421 type:complete len:260 (+) Transcript_21983:128-907(+)